MPEAKDVHKYIVEARDYFDQHNRKVRERIVVHGRPPPGFARFITRSSLEVPLPEHTVRLEFTVHLPAESVVEAYEIMDAEIERVVKQKKVEALEKAAEMRRKVIIAGPGAMEKVEARRRELGRKTQ